MFGLFRKVYLILTCIIYKKRRGSNMTQFTAVASEVVWVKRKLSENYPLGLWEYALFPKTVLFPSSCTANIP